MSKKRLSRMSHGIIWLALLLAAIGFLDPASTLAHDLLQTYPEPGAQLAISPPQVRLYFSDYAVESTISVVSWETLREVQQSTPQPDPENPVVLFVTLPELEPGRYSVNWYVEGRDGDFLEDSFEFEVLTPEVAATVIAESPEEGEVRFPIGLAPPRESTEPSVPVTTAPAPAPQPPLPALLGALTLLIGVLVVLYLRFRRSQTQEH